MKKEKKVTDEKKYFYYVRDKKNRPVVTVCLIKGSNGIGKGIAVCSLDDNPIKIVGKDIAMRRALKAYWQKWNDVPIWSESAMDVLEPIEDSSILIGNMKIEYNPMLSERELRMLKEDGYGNCTDCGWYKDPGGCNVERDSPACLLNRRQQED